MKVFLNEITDQDMSLEFTQDDAWLLDAVCGVDECEIPAPTKSESSRPVKAQVSLRKVDNVIVVSGKIETHIDLICSRCACQFHLFCRPKFSALFCNDPEVAGVAYLPKKQNSEKRRSPNGLNRTEPPSNPCGKNAGFARHSHDSENDEAIETGQDLDITYLSEDYIDLGEVMAEQLQLQVPFQPLCKESCHGICSQCGVDLNTATCTCPRFKSNPFSILNDLN